MFRLCKKAEKAVGRQQNGGAGSAGADDMEGVKRKGVVSVIGVSAPTVVKRQIQRRQYRKLKFGRFIAYFYHSKYLVDHRTPRTCAVISGTPNCHSPRESFQSPASRPSNGAFQAW